MKILHLSITILLTTFLFVSCEDSNEAQDNTSVTAADSISNISAGSIRQNCDSIACEEVFVTVFVKIKNKSGTPQSLDDHYTIVKSTGDTIRDDSGPYPDGTYIIITDKQQKKLEYNPTNYIFYGIKKGSVIIKEPYVVSADCCHINMISGKPEVTIL